MNDNVKHHLTYLAAGSEMASRHARALPFKPPFTTAAQDELLDAERALEVALQHVREAMAEYEAKPQVRDPFFAPEDFTVNQQWRGWT